jgi:ribonuclease D
MWQIGFPVKDYQYIDSVAALDGLIKNLHGSDHVAIDTEADSLHHYFEKVCLIQISTNSAHYIVDPLAEMDLAPLLKILATKPLILHGSDFDLRMLLSSFGFTPKGGVFDTMIASQLLGFDGVGLAALVKRYFNITLSKKGQKADWSARPLSQELLNYAINDTRYLGAIEDELKALLTSKGRLEWHAEWCARIVRITLENRQRDVDEAWRIKGCGLLAKRELAFVREIWKWREEEAKIVDLPPFKIMTNQLIIDLASWAASIQSIDLESGPRLPRNCRRKRLEALKSFLEIARALEESEWPTTKKHKRPKSTPGFGHIMSSLREGCRKLAKELEIDPSVIASRKTLEIVAAKRLKTIDELISVADLMKWQAELILPIMTKLQR